MKQYLTTKEVAAAMGVTRRGVDQLCARGELTFYKPSKHRLFDPDDVEKLIQSSKCEAVK